MSCPRSRWRPSLCCARAACLVANTFHPATVIFSDRPGDTITSDYLTTGNHTYANGGSVKLEVGFYAVTADLVLKQLTGPLPRYLAFSFTPITPAGAPSGSLTERNIFMNVHGILTMPPGTAKNARTQFGTAVGNFKHNPNWVDTTTYATEVLVYRTGNVWTVTADPGVPPGPGDVAGLIKTKGNTTQLLGQYHMPFQISVSCPTCP